MCDMVQGLTEWMESNKDWQEVVVFEDGTIIVFYKPESAMKVLDDDQATDGCTV